MADDSNPQYNNVNRAFLQAFISRGTLTFEEAKPIIAAISTVHGKKHHSTATLKRFGALEN